MKTDKKPAFALSAFIGGSFAFVEPFDSPYHFSVFGFTVALPVSFPMVRLTGTVVVTVSAADASMVETARRAGVDVQFHRERAKGANRGDCLAGSRQGHRLGAVKAVIRKHQDRASWTRGSGTEANAYGDAASRGQGDRQHRPRLLKVAGIGPAKRDRGDSEWIGPLVRDSDQSGRCHQPHRLVPKPTLAGATVTMGAITAREWLPRACGYTPLAQAAPQQNTWSQSSRQEDVNSSSAFIRVHRRLIILAADEHR